jgi:TonB family protein
MKTVCLLFCCAFMSAILTGDGSFGQSRRYRRQRSRPVANPGETKSTPSSAAEDERIAEECSLPNRPQPETRLKGDALACGKAVSLPKPPYPKEAKAAKATGTIRVQVVIDEEGRMIWAKAVSGPSLLQEVSVKAACRARFLPIKISGRAVKAEGIITYNFLAENSLASQDQK